MRLYLSSYRLGSGLSQLNSLLRGQKIIAVIKNALDMIPDQKRNEYEKNVYCPKQELVHSGYAAEELDLRQYFNFPGELEEKLLQFDFVWAIGGNAFLLRKAMKYSGFGSVIAKLLASDNIAYGGFSAGAVVAAPSLRGIEIMDDPNTEAPNYDSEVIWDGLNLIDFHIVPHFQSDHPEAHLAALAAAHYENLRIPYQALRDGEVLIVDGEQGLRKI